MITTKPYLRIDEETGLLAIGETFYLWDYSGHLLGKMVANEDYENAAILRDLIKEHESTHH